MDETRFLTLMKRARNFSHLGERLDYWHGYQRGLRRGFQGELFGTNDEHQRWLRLADEGADEASRERGRGYRDGLRACREDREDQAIRGLSRPEMSVPSKPPADARRR
jgi:hypothetical protein